MPSVDRPLDSLTDYPIAERDVFLDERFPRLYFIEHAYASDRTNWWIPNAACASGRLVAAA